MQFIYSIQWSECVPYSTHMIYIMWSLEQAPKTWMGVSDKRDIQKDQDWYDSYCAWTKRI